MQVVADIMRSPSSVHYDEKAYTHDEHGRIKEVSRTPTHTTSQPQTTVRDGDRAYPDRYVDSNGKTSAFPHKIFRQEMFDTCHTFYGQYWFKRTRDYDHYVACDHDLCLCASDTCEKVHDRHQNPAKPSTSAYLVGRGW